MYKQALPLFSNGLCTYLADLKTVLIKYQPLKSFHDKTVYYNINKTMKNLKKRCLDNMTDSLSGQLHEQSDYRSLTVIK